MADNFPNSLGINPVKLLLAKSSNWSCASCDIFGGISLVKWFDLSLRIFRAGTPIPTHGGNLPKNMLFPISRVARDPHPLTTDGKTPVKPLPARWSDSSEQLCDGGASGISPEKELLDRSMNCKACICHQQFGSSPVSLLLDRSSFCSDSSLQKAEPDLLEEA